MEGLSPRRWKLREEELGWLLLARGVDKVAFSGVGGGGGGFEVPLRRMESDYLYTYLAGDVGAYVAEGSGETAVCFFRTVGPMEERALLKLAESFRYLMLSTQRDSAAICRALRQRYGLPVVEDPRPSQVRRADFALLLHPPRRDMTLSERCLAFWPSMRPSCPAVGGVPIRGLFLDVPPALVAEIPAGFCPGPILSEAAFRGLIDPGRIKIHGVSLDKDS